MKITVTSSHGPWEPGDSDIDHSDVCQHRDKYPRATLVIMGTCCKLIDISMSHSFIKCTQITVPPLNGPGSSE